jgi:hypothetical protein
VNPSEIRRVEALAQAVKSFMSVDCSTEAIVNRAKKFEAYLSGETELMSVQVQGPPPKVSKPVTDRPTLEKPVHETRVGGDGPECLACEWNGLKKRIDDAR